jgi:hypothetical protein
MKLNRENLPALAENAIAKKIADAAFPIHTTLGPGVSIVCPQGSLDVPTMPMLRLSAARRGIAVQAAYKRPVVRASVVACAISLPPAKMRRPAPFWKCSPVRSHKMASSRP